MKQSPPTRKTWAPKTGPRQTAKTAKQRVDENGTVLSALTSVGGALYSSCRSLWFRIMLKIRRDSSGLNSKNLVKLLPLSGPSTGDLIIVVPGTWSGHWNLPDSPLQVLLAKIKIDHKDRRIFLAPWFAVNNHDLRKRAAANLATLVSAELHEGETVSFVGHSHGGTLVAIERCKKSTRKRSTASKVVQLHAGKN